MHVVQMETPALDFIKKMVSTKTKTHHITSVDNTIATKMIEQCPKGVYEL